MHKNGWTDNFTDGLITITITKDFLNCLVPAKLHKFVDSRSSLKIKMDNFNKFTNIYNNFLNFISNLI